MCRNLPNRINYREISKGAILALNISALSTDRKIRMTKSKGSQTVRFGIRKGLSRPVKQKSGSYHQS
jgi:hypothetical protein